MLVRWREAIDRGGEPSDAQIQELLGPAAAGALRWASGLRVAVAHEDKEWAVASRMASIALADGFEAFPHPHAVSWRDVGRRFAARLSDAAGVISKAPQFFTAYTYGLLFNLVEREASAGSPLELLSEEERLRAPFVEPELGRVWTVQAFDRAPTVHTSTTSFTFGRSSFNVKPGDEEKRRRAGAPLASPKETVIFLLLERHWVRTMGASERNLRVAEIAGSWGWEQSNGFATYDGRGGWTPAPFNHARQSDPLRAGTSLNDKILMQDGAMIETRLRRLRKSEFAPTVEAIATWYEHTFENGWGPAVPI